MNNREKCPMRHENGNCLSCGGFCTAVNDEICNALHNAYYKGYNVCLQDHKDSILPYNIGDVFYKAYYWRDDICEDKVSGLTKKADGTWKIRLSSKNMGVYEIKLSEIGKTVFRTAKEAEVALREMRKSNAKVN